MWQALGFKHLSPLGGFMAGMYRSSGSNSYGSFNRGARRTRRENVYVMRGGFRL